MATSDIGKIKTRIRALAGRTVANGCTPAEADAAARMVRELMRKHGLTAADVARDEAPAAHSWSSAPRSGRSQDNESDPSGRGFGRAQPDSDEPPEAEDWTQQPLAPRGFPWKFAGIMAVIMVLAGGATIAGLMGLSRVVNGKAITRHIPRPDQPIEVGPAGIPMDPPKSPAATVHAAPDGEECQGVVLISGGYRKDCVEIDAAAGGRTRR